MEKATNDLRLAKTKLEKAERELEKAERELETAETYRNAQEFQSDKWKFFNEEVSQCSAMVTSATAVVTSAGAMVLNLTPAPGTYSLPHPHTRIRHNPAPLADFSLSSPSMPFIPFNAFHPLQCQQPLLLRFEFLSLMLPPPSQLRDWHCSRYYHLMQAPLLRLPYHCVGLGLFAFPFMQASLLRLVYKWLFHFF